MPTKTAIYCRTKTHDPQAIAAQRAALEACAAGLGFSQLAYYEDDGFSARDANRPAFAQLNQDILDGKIARVLVKSLTRLGRNTAEVMHWARWLNDCGADIHIIDRYGLDELTGKLLTKIS